MRFRGLAVPAIVVALGGAAIGATTTLDTRAAASRNSELQMARLEVALNSLQKAPFRSNAATGGSPRIARDLIRQTEGEIDSTLAALLAGSPPATLRQVDAPLEENYGIIEEIYRIGVSSDGFGPKADTLSGQSNFVGDYIFQLLDSSAKDYHHRAWLAETEAAAGSAGAIVLLLLAFTFLFLRASRARAAVQRSEERFRTLVSNIPCAVYRREADFNWTTLLVSSGIEDIVGYPAESFGPEGRSLGDLVDLRWREVVDVDVALVPSGHFIREYEIAHADGGTRWVQDRGQAVRDEHGDIAWIDGTYTDVTLVKELERERERLELERRVAQRLETVGQLAAGIAHEINTPVQFVGDTVGFLRTSFADLSVLVEEYRRICREAGAAEAVAAAEDEADLEFLVERIPPALDRAADGLNRVATIVAAVKDFGRSPQSECTPADLNEAIRTTLVVAQSEVHHVAEVVTELAELPAVVCNVGEINQVLLNLVVNAAHAVEDAGPTRGQIRVRSWCDAADAYVSVSDSGTGIPEEVRDRVFDPFFTTKPVGRGSGQGLAISHSIVVEKHRGFLGFESEVGVGTTFTIRLPIAGPGALQAAA
jgi:PAS domain S-box-containing protein